MGTDNSSDDNPHGQGACSRCGDPVGRFASSGRFRKFCSNCARGGERNPLHLVCAFCGEGFESSRKRRFCSPRCRDRRRLPCRSCGSILERARTATACCPSCVRRLRRSKCQCRGCGKEFRPKAADRTTFCSRACAFAFLAERRNRRRNERAWARLKPCAVCSRLTIHRYCCNPCRLTVSRGHARDRWRRLRGGLQAGRITCRVCGETFDVQRRASRRVFCSKACARKDNKSKERLSERGRDRTGDRRRARIVSAGGRFSSFEGWVEVPDLRQVRGTPCGSAPSSGAGH